MPTSAASAASAETIPLRPAARNSTAPIEPAISTMQMAMNIALMRNMKHP